MKLSILIFTLLLSSLSLESSAAVKASGLTARNTYFDCDNGGHGVISVLFLGENRADTLMLTKPRFSGMPQMGMLEETGTKIKAKFFSPETYTAVTLIKDNTKGKNFIILTDDDFISCKFK